MDNIKKLLECFSNNKLAEAEIHLKNIISEKVFAKLQEKKTSINILDFEDFSVDEQTTSDSINRIDAQKRAVSIIHPHQNIEKIDSHRKELENKLERLSKRKAL